MAGDTVLILGAGFPKPAGGPLLRDLLTPACVGQSEADPVVLDALSRGLTERRDEFPSATVEDLFTDIWREARTGGDFVIEGEAWPAKILLAGITNHLASVCGRVHLRRSTSLWSAYTGFVSFLLANSRSLAVLTFNY